MSCEILYVCNYLRSLFIYLFIYLIKYFILYVGDGGALVLTLLFFRSLFPHGDSMVCIIDDREDVWDFAPNLIRVKPYQYFKGVGDINAPLRAVESTAAHPIPGECINASKQKELADKVGVSNEESTNEEKGQTDKKHHDVGNDQKKSLAGSEEELTATTFNAKEGDNNGDCEDSIHGCEINNVSTVGGEEEEEEAKVSSAGDDGKEVRTEKLPKQSDVRSSVEEGNGDDKRKEKEEQKQSTNKELEGKQEEQISEKNKHPSENDPDNHEKGLSKRL